MKLNSQNLNINLRHLRALHMIAQTGSFTRAADRLGVVPSALSETIRQLEESAGLALFDRTTRPPQLTPAGARFIAETTDALAGFDTALERLRQSAALGWGRLKIGASPSVIAQILAPALAQFRATWPKIAIELHDGPAEDLARQVAEGPLDLAIAGATDTGAGLWVDEISRDPFGLALSPKHPLAQISRPLRLADVDPESLIHLDQSSGTARLLQDAAALPPAYRQGRFQVASTFGQLCLIRAGLGVALLPQNAVTLFEDPKVVFRPLADLALDRRLRVLRPKTRALSHEAQAFYALLKAGLPK